ncbi:MAG: hypothetical protein F4Z01_05000 [Gammaproteobacteria bacterium]|nr:hypothetical protein [Gammaproteobacteria bacterium]MYF38865.1 hypothetical protein [Gammaproteobacteria bacterium]
MKKHFLLVALGFAATLAFAKDLTGVFEIPHAEGEEDDVPRVEVTIHDNGTCSARVLIGNWTSSTGGGRDPNFLIKTTFRVGQVLQTWQVSLAKDEITMSVKEGNVIKSRKHTWIGKLTYDFEGTFEFPPPEGETDDVILVELIKNHEDEYSVQVTVHDEVVRATNVTVVEDQFTFDVETSTPDGTKSKSWTVAIIDGKINLTLLSDEDGKDSTLTRLGRLVSDETE